MSIKYEGASLCTRHFCTTRLEPDPVMHREPVEFLTDGGRDAIIFLYSQNQTIIVLFIFNLMQTIQIWRICVLFQLQFDCKLII